MEGGGGRASTPAVVGHNVAAAAHKGRVAAIAIAPASIYAPQCNLTRQTTDNPAPCRRATAELPAAMSARGVAGFDRVCGVCVRARACLRACVRARARARMCVCFVRARARVRSCLPWQPVAAHAAHELRAGGN